MSSPSTAAGRRVTVAVSSNKRGWRVKVDASDGDSKTEAEVAGRVIALLAQVAVDMSARAALLDELEAKATGRPIYWDLSAVLALLREARG